MRVEIEVHDYSPKDGLVVTGEPNFQVSTRLESGPDELVIRANREGLRALAGALLTLTDPNVPSETHLHLTEHNGFLAAGSVGLILELVSSE
jgi:hypothetical protein